MVKMLSIFFITYFLQWKMKIFFPMSLMKRKIFCRYYFYISMIFFFVSYLFLFIILCNEKVENCYFSFPFKKASTFLLIHEFYKSFIPLYSIRAIIEILNLSRIHRVEKFLAYEHKIFRGGRIYNY